MAFSLGRFTVAKTIILWDVVGCPIPKHLDAVTVVQNVTEALADMGYRSMESTSIRAYCDITESAEALEGIPMKHQPAEPQDERRMNILVDFICEAIGKFVPLNLMLITGDISREEAEFFNALRFLRGRQNINVLLAQHPGKDVSESLRGAVTSVWCWSSLAHGGYPIGVEQSETDSGDENL